MNIYRIFRGFTLTEILITLAIVGVIAALTIPALISKIDKKITENQMVVFESKLIKGLNLTKTSGDMTPYNSTYDFLNYGLSKHLKMAKICNFTNIQDCIPYKTIKYTRNETEEMVNIKDLTAAKLRLDDRKFNDIASFVLGDGTIVIAAYKLDCLVDTEQLDKNINPCFAGIYDLNGTRKPNKLGKDIQTFNGAGIDGAILTSLNGVKIISNLQYLNSIPTSEYCDTSNPDSSKWTVKPEYSKFISKCCELYDCRDETKGDYWASAAIECHKMGGKLPSEQQLADIANALYGGKAGGGSYSASDNLGYYAGAGSLGSNQPIPATLSKLGGACCYDLWSDNEISGSNAYYRTFLGGKSRRNTDFSRARTGTPKAICVAE